jgi:hypothetical protein
MRVLIYALMFTLGGTVAVSAEELKPIQAKTITLGTINGVAYYTIEPKGFQVVTSILAGDDMIRFTTTLLRDQKVILSVPGEVGEKVKQIEFERRGDQLYVAEPLLLN